MGRCTRFLPFVLAITLLGGWMIPVQAEDYPNVKIGNPVSRAVQKVTGITLLSGWIGSRVAKNLLQKELGGEVNVSLKPFSATDLIAGKARRLEIRGENLLIDDMLPIRAFTVETLGDSPIFVRKGRKPVLMRPVEFRVSAVVDEENLKTFLESEKGRKQLTRIKVPLPPYKKPQYLDVLDPAVSIRDGKLIIDSFVNVHGAPKANGLPVKVSTGLKPVDDTLKLDGVKIDIPGIRKTRGAEKFVERFFTELFDVSKIRIDRHKIIMAYDKSELTGNRLLIEAHGYIKPDGKGLKLLSEND